MSNVVVAHAVSIDGFISGRDPSDADGGFGRGLGDAPMLFDWYFDGDTPSEVFRGFRLSPASAEVFDALAGRLGAVVAGHTTYEHSSRFTSGSPHPNAPLVVLSHGEVEGLGASQTQATTIEGAIAAAREIAGERDVGLMGGGVASSALAAGLVDEIVLHQVPILLGAGRRFFDSLPRQIQLEQTEVVVAPGVTHLRFAVTR